MAFMTALAALRLKGIVRLAAIVPVLLASAVVIANGGHPEEFGFAAQLARFVFAFYLGVGCWFARHLIPIRARTALLFLTVATVAAWSDLPVRYPVMILATGYLSFWAGSIAMGALQRWTARTDLSYGVYITGFFIQQWLVYAFPQINVWQNAIAATVLALAAAWLSWTFVEKPALGLRHRLAFTRLPHTKLQPAE